MMAVRNPSASTHACTRSQAAPMQRGIAHDAALADLALAHFKLRLDQYNHFATFASSSGTIAGISRVTEMKLTSQTARSNVLAEYLPRRDSAR